MAIKFLGSSREPYLTFDDVSIAPAFSSIASRLNGDINIGTEVCGLHMEVPIFSSNMDTVTENHLASTLYDAGGLGIIHRFLPPGEHRRQLSLIRGPKILSVGVGESERARIEEILVPKMRVDAICIDIAHGHCKAMLDMIKHIKDTYNLPIIAGNVATVDGVAELASAGAAAIKVGIGGGSHCSTRVVTGCGIPQLEAISEAASIAAGVKIISDGGIRSSGDIVKALAAGADAVMIGELFSHCKEAPGEIIKSPQGIPHKAFRGMASSEAQLDWKGYVSVEEGEQSLVEINTDVMILVEKLSRGIKSGFSYVGARNIKELRENTYFILQTHNGFQEGLPRSKKVT
jgi:IMP dehydrogenase